MDAKEKLSTSESAQFDIAAMRENADKACRMMKTLANRDRLMLLCQLSQGEKRVGELEAVTNIQQPTLSQQLAVLREEGVVSTRRDGKHIHYKISSPIAMSVMELLYESYCSK